MAFLKQIERGSITLTPLESVPHNGNVTYQASNGWKITVCVRAQAFDYIEEIAHPGGSLSFNQVPEYNGLFLFEEYRPPKATLQDAYGIGSRN